MKICKKSIRKGAFLCFAENFRETLQLLLRNSDRMEFRTNLCYNDVNNMTTPAPGRKFQRSNRIMNMKKIKNLIILCALIFSLSACAEPSAVEIDKTIDPTGQQPSPTITLIPTVTPLLTEEPLPTITWVPTVTPIVTPLPTNTPSTFTLTYLDVGQGDAAIISCDGHYMLIDGGDTSCSNQIYSYLKRNEISTLDIVVASHAHVDHVGGLSGALNYATSGLVLCPVTEYDTDAFRDFVKYAEKNGPGITVPKKLSNYSLGSATVTILGLNAGEGNDSSIVLSVTYQDKVFLFTGDAEREAEQAVLADYPELLAADVLKVGHHGSADATTYPFLREILPEIAVISCGAGNPYGHPTDNVLSRLRDAEVTVYRTDLHGDITIGYDGEEWSVTTQKSASEEDVFAPGEDFNFANQGSDEGDDVTRGDTGSVTTGLDYIANKNTKKFHYPECSSVKRMKESNKVYFNGVTREYMIGQGYDPCANCDP